MAKRLMQEIKLRFFDDPASGEWGVSHFNTIEDDGDSFNAFWDGMGLFHDVYEHNVEYTKHFTSTNAMNQGGEMAAMGALLYYVSELGVFNRLRSGSIYSHEEMACKVTLDPIMEGIQSGEPQFGDTLECGVPTQKPVDNYALTCVIDQFMEEIQDVEFEPSQWTEDYHREASDDLRASVTRDKVANLHTWGFRNGRRLVPDTNDNMSLLVEFVKFWNQFCKQNSAEELGSYFRGITFHLYRKGREASWTATFEPSYGAGLKEYVVSSDHISYVPHTMDMVESSYDEEE